MQQYHHQTLTKKRQPKAKIEKSAEEFKQHEALIMNKRIAEINNVITKKCHTLWNQYLFDKKKPQLGFHFTYHGFENYLKKCDDYKPEQHKDNKQKWWNNQKASEMSQDFLPAVLNATDQMGQYLGKQISQPELIPEFQQYLRFELLETAIMSVFSTQRSGSNEVFLRTSFQYAKAGLRKKLVSCFGDGELRQYDTKSRKKKDLWQKLIKDKKERLLNIFLNKKSRYTNDSKAGILQQQRRQNNNNNHMNMNMNRHNVHSRNNNGHDIKFVNTSNNNYNSYSSNYNDQYGISNNSYDNYNHNSTNFPSNSNNNNGYYNNSNSSINNLNNFGMSMNNMSNMNGMNNMNNMNMNNSNMGNMNDMFNQPLLMDITVTYPGNAPPNTNSMGVSSIPPVGVPQLPQVVPNKTKIYNTNNSNMNGMNNMNNLNNINNMNNMNSMNNMNNINGMSNMSNMNNMNNMNRSNNNNNKFANNNNNSNNSNNNGVCRKCMNYQNQMVVLLEENQKLQTEISNIKQLNEQYELDKNRQKQKYDQLLLNYNQLQDQQIMNMKQQNNIQTKNNNNQSNMDISSPKDQHGTWSPHQEDNNDGIRFEQEPNGDICVKLTKISNDDDDINNSTRARKNTPSYTGMSMDDPSANERNQFLIETPTNKQIVPFDTLTQTPKNNQKIQPLNGFNPNNLNFNSSNITPMGDQQISFPFPLNGDDDDKNNNEPQLTNTNSNHSTNTSSNSTININNKNNGCMNNDDNKSEMSASTFGAMNQQQQRNRNQNQNQNHSTSVQPSNMSVCSSNNNDQHTTQALGPTITKYKSKLPSINQNISRSYPQAPSFSHSHMTSINIPNNNNNNNNNNIKIQTNNNTSSNMDASQMIQNDFRKNSNSSNNSYPPSLGSNNSLWNNHRISDGNLTNLSTPSNSNKFAFAKDPNGNF